MVDKWWPKFWGVTIRPWMWLEQQKFQSTRLMKQKQNSMLRIQSGKDQKYGWTPSWNINREQRKREREITKGNKGKNGGGVRKRIFQGPGFANRRLRSRTIRSVVALLVSWFNGLCWRVKLGETTVAFRWMLCRNPELVVWLGVGGHSLKFCSWWATCARQLGVSWSGEVRDHGRNVDTNHFLNSYTVRLG